MTLHLVRHGEAKAKHEDPDRPLTEQGMLEVTRVASLVAIAGAKPEQILHSGKMRAEQTAAIFAQHLNPPEGSVAISGLAPNDPVEPIADLTFDSTKDLMLVGHLPFMDRLGCYLLCGNAEANLFIFKAASVVCLEVSASRTQLAWMVTPDLILQNPNAHSMES